MRFDRTDPESFLETARDARMEALAVSLDHALVFFSTTLALMLAGFCVLAVLVGLLELAV